MQGEEEVEEEQLHVEKVDWWADDAAAASAAVFFIRHHLDVTSSDSFYSARHSAGGEE